MALFVVAHSSVVSTDRSRRRICGRRGRKFISRCAVYKAGFGHVSWRASLNMTCGFASSTKPRAQRQCTSHKRDRTGQDRIGQDTYDAWYGKGVIAPDISEAVLLT